MAKFDIKKPRNLTFARFGGLSSVNQRGYRTKERNFHTPPARRGFYAFVWPLYEPFLLGGSWTCWPWVTGSKFTYVRDSDGNIVTNKHSDVEKYTDKNKVFSVPTKNWNKYCDLVENCSFKERERLDKEWEEKHGGEPKLMYALRPRPKIFEYSGPIWHHLGGNLKPYQILKAAGSWSMSDTVDFHEALLKEIHSTKRENMRWYTDANVAQPKGYRGGRDHLEVFIEKL